MATFLRTSRTRIVAVTALALCAVLLTGCLTGAQQAVLDELNADRAGYGRTTLPTHDMLNEKAQAWAEHLARVGGLGHSNLTAGLPGCWRGVGENVGYGTSAAAVENGYMASSQHRANILNTTWDFVGVGWARASNSRIYTVQVFMDGCA